MVTLDVSHCLVVCWTAPKCLTNILPSLQSRPLQDELYLIRGLLKIDASFFYPALSSLCNLQATCWQHQTEVIIMGRNKSDRHQHVTDCCCQNVSKMFKWVPGTGSLVFMAAFTSAQHIIMFTDGDRLALSPLHNSTLSSEVPPCSPSVFVFPFKAPWSLCRAVLFTWRSGRKPTQLVGLLTFDKRVTHQDESLNQTNIYATLSWQIHP